MISGVTQQLNEAILGHHALQHTNEDLVQFVDSLDLTGDAQVDDALWAHHGTHHKAAMTQNYHYSVPHAEVPVIAAPLGHIAADLKNVVVKTIAAQHVTHSTWEASAYSIMYAVAMCASFLGFYMAWFTKDGSFGNNLSQAHMMSGVSFMAAGLVCWMTMCYYLAFVLGNLTWLFITFSLMRFHHHNTIKDVVEEHKHMQVAMIHTATCAAWLVAAIWINGPMWTYFWMVTMAANVAYANHVASKKHNGNGFGTFIWVNYSALAAMVVYSFLWTWMWNTDNVLI
jgi:hypothetical protein